jgi:hypothetical protein
LHQEEVEVEASMEAEVVVPTVFHQLRTEAEVVVLDRA